MLRRIPLTAALFLAVVPLTAQDTQPAPPSPEARKATFQRVCGGCHKPEAVVHGRRTKGQWQDSVEKMISKGAKGSEDDFLDVLDYLVAEFGKVNLNRATPSEITQVLGIPESEAALIVKHRRANGRFEEFENLSKVQGLDLKPLEKKRDAISF